jgi:hypothetical protein
VPIFIGRGVPGKHVPGVPGLWRGGFRPPRLKKVNELAGARNAPAATRASCNLIRSVQAPVGFSMRPTQSYGDKAGD